jgi:hypothetical protein
MILFLLRAVGGPRLGGIPDEGHYIRQAMRLRVEAGKFVGERHWKKEGALCAKHCWSVLGF